MDQAGKMATVVKDSKVMVLIGKKTNSIILCIVCLIGDMDFLTVHFIMNGKKRRRNRP